MNADAVIETTRAAPLSADELRTLGKRSDAQGLLRFAGHLLAIGGAGTLYAVCIARGAPFVVCGACAVVLGFTLVTMFATMHECVHRTAFKTRWLNDSVGWIGGLLSFYSSSFYRPYHGWHHRFTQLSEQDPELEDVKPVSVGGYLVQLSGLPWWFGKCRTYVKLVTGRVAGYGFLNEKNAPGVVRSVRLQMLTYAAAIAASVALGYPYFVVYWLIPVAVAQPLLRAILLAEHMGCSDDADMLANTRTTYTAWPVRFLMWEMPYHADHHRYPALPFFVLARAHGKLAPHLTHIAHRGYTGLHVELVRGLRKRVPAVNKDTPREGKALP